MDLSLNQSVLGYSALYKYYNAPVDYHVEGDTKVLHRRINSNNEQQQLISLFKSKPENILRSCRLAIRAIALDDRIGATHKENRVKRYLEQYFDMIIKFDSVIVDHNLDQIYSGVPDYIPDGFVDFGSNSNLSNEHRYGREKIIINKKDIFSNYFDFLYKIFTHPNLSDRDIVYSIYYLIFKKPYSKTTSTYGLFGSIPLHNIDVDNLMVCRHKALLFQILLQTCGVTSKLLKCDIKFNERDSFGAHAANLVYIDSPWYLVDPTNLICGANSKAIPTIIPLPDKNIDINKNNFTWSFMSGSDKRAYRSRSNLYYQIR